MNVANFLTFVLDILFVVKRWSLIVEKISEKITRSRWGKPDKTPKSSNY